MHRGDGAVSTTGFAVEPVKKKQGTGRTVTFAEVTLIHEVKHTWRDALMGGAVFGILVAVAIAMHRVNVPL